MKFPRHARVFRGNLDAAPFACVVFCLLIFVLLSALVYTPSVRLALAGSGRVPPGGEGPTIAVALGANGQFYYQNQTIVESNLLQQLKAEVAGHSEPLTLVIQADKSVTLGQFDHLRELAARAGIRQIWQTVLPRAFDSPGESFSP